MNWDWDKLQEKRQQQQKNGWGSAGRGNWGKGDDDRDDSQKNDNRNRQGGGSPKGGRPSFSWPKAPQIDGLPKMRWWILGALVVWMLSGIYIVQPDESGVVLRFGKYVRTENPGPHIHLPYPIETVYKPKVSQVRQTAVGYRAQSVGGVFQQGRVQAVNEESAMLTGDENIINVQFNIQYQIKPDGAVDYLFNVIQPDQVVKRAAEASMREVIGKTTLDSALTDGRVQIQNDVADLLQRILDRYQVGVQVVAVQMQDVQPPREVSDSFKDVASAREDKQRSINEAEAYRRDILPKAQGQAQEMINKAEAYKETRVREAEGEAQRFLSVLAEYEKAEDVTKKRMLYETFEDILSKPGMEKLVLPSDTGSRVLPLLPLDSWKGGDAAKGGTQK
ncbi:FtsH protease activity modulator HflK [uncultured Mailhella sp.]|uniref:FtsH protease activity modulator HflK n=1 Tax=uncultured Mailhella sp. TaxID=1981031 RepID=UPI00320A9481